MAPTSSRRRPFNTRPRSVRRSQVGQGFSEDLQEPPLKRLRYVPGGPGGGGRYIDVDGTEIPVHGSRGHGSAGNTPHARDRKRRESAASRATPLGSSRPRRERVARTPKFSPSAAVAAVVQGDGYKPREERGWEEFHPDLDLDAKLPVFSSDQVDGVVSLFQGAVTDGVTGTFLAGVGTVPGTPGSSTPKRRPGRPPRRPDSMLQGIGTPDVPKTVPLPGPNPREKLTLPRPSFRLVDPFTAFETQGSLQQNYVDRVMAMVGYQESDMFTRSPRRLIRAAEGAIEEDLDLGPTLVSDSDVNAAIGSTGVGRVEYDMDEQDEQWLEAYNAQRKEDQVDAIKPAVFEVTMTKIEKEWHALEKRIPKPNPKPPQTHRPRSSSAAGINGEPHAAGEEQDTKCAICDDGDCENTNAIVFCDGCDLAVHQECYGVPFIPEGQWLCRKCQLLGRGIPTCIFCPNTDGAFKQTSSSRWAHLLCAIWIPEVSLGNTTFMEPVMEVEKVPRQRWKLTCYICHQKMGACIQCSNKNCYLAFHVTCARRAQLFLKMKSSQGFSATLEPNFLKAYCDKHSPQDWVKEHKTDSAIVEAIEYYKNAMRDRVWADSQQSALTAVPPPQGLLQADATEENQPGTSTAVSSSVPKRKRNEPKRVVWRLPSGAPVIPQALFNSVESSLSRFAIRKRKDYAADACKYWTLKREARRGAALLKRLQLQMEIFTSMEITRRDFSSLGVAGNRRLKRRISFAEHLEKDVDKLRMLCDEVKKREREKLQDAELLKNIVDVVYFPIGPMLQPIMDKLHRLDSNNIFREGLDEMQIKLDQRYYTSVTTFSADLRAVLGSAISITAPSSDSDEQLHINADLTTKDLTPEQKERRKFAKRLIKAAQSALQDSMHKESDLSQKPFERELRELDMFLEGGDSSPRQGSLEPGAEENAHLGGACTSTQILANATSTNDQVGVGQLVGEHTNDKMDATFNASANNDHAILPELNSQANAEVATALSERTPDLPMQSIESNPHADNSSTLAASQEEDEHLPLYHGGIPWYMEPFDPEGTTIHEERWTGREVVSRMSEELSEIDEEELEVLAAEENGGDANTASNMSDSTTTKSTTTGKKKRRKHRAFR